MWSFVKVPVVPNESAEGVVCLERYFVNEGDEIRKGDAVALAHTNRTSFHIVSNYHGRVLKLILRNNDLVAFRDPIATIELLEDPIDGLLIEHCKVLR